MKASHAQTIVLIELVFLAALHTNIIQKITTLTHVAFTGNLNTTQEHIFNR